MAETSHQFSIGALSGQDKRLRAGAMRAATSLTEPFYATAMAVRTLCYNRGFFRSYHLPSPTISIGNITTGGTGKTPVVQWLAGRLRDHGLHPAVLLRGYHSNVAGISDEQQLLDRALNKPGPASIPVVANPSRINAAADLLKTRDDINIFLLDDAFQHRKVRRDFDLVLVSATNPFGFGRVLPRGLLREALAGLNRADAFLITRASQTDQKSLQGIEAELRRRNPSAHIYHADHAHTALYTPATEERVPMIMLQGQSYFMFCGIGNPEAFGQQLNELGGICAGRIWFPDHHAYTQADVEEIKSRAIAGGATRIITSQKDWVKLAALPGVLNADPAFSVVELAIQFRPTDEDRLFAQMVSVRNQPSW